MSPTQYTTTCSHFVHTHIIKYFPIESYYCKDAAVTLSHIRSDKRIKHFDM